MAEPEVVIIGSDGKTEHVFPAGFDPKVAAAIVRKQESGIASPAAAPAKPETPKGELIYSNRIVDTGVQNAPLVGGAIGGFMGGPLGAAAGGAVGSLVKQSVNTATGRSTEPVTPLGAATDVVTQGAVQGALEYGGGLAMRGVGKLGTAVYRSYLKPSLAAKSIGEADELVQTAIKEWLPVTHGGVAKGQRIIGELHAEVKRILGSTKGDIDLQDVADQVRQWATKKYYKPGVASADYDAAMGVADSIDHHASQSVPSFIRRPRPTADALKANEIKQGLQAKGADASLMEREATKQASEAGGHYMKVALEKLAPGIAPLNARESKLIPAAEAINRAVQREMNQYKMHGTKAIVGGIVGSEEYARTKDPWSAAAKGLATTIALQPGVATRLAMVAARLGRLSGDIPANVARAALAAVLNGSDEGETPMVPGTGLAPVGVEADQPLAPLGVQTQEKP